MRTMTSNKWEMPSGVDLTLAELQEMAARQQQQIEAQQQMLVAKEQRLKFLKQQELRHQQIASENERLRQLREKVEAQELKLKKLRALRGQANDQRAKNTSLTAELESIKSLFNEKEKELSVAVVKVEDLTKQLEELRKGRLNGLNGTNNAQTSSMVELEKLRKELTLRNKVNEQQNTKLAAHREILEQRKDEMARMDSRIAELQSRLRKKQLEQKQQSGRLAEGKKGSNVAAVEPYIQRMPHSREDSTLSDIVKPNDDQFQKQDPKYQTLPYNIKFPELDERQDVQAQDDSRGKGDGGEAGTVSEAKPGAAPYRVISHFAPKPYGSYRTATPSGSQPPKDVVDSPSVLYSGSPSTGTPPKTSTPVGLVGYGNKTKEIFITGAPTQPSMSPARTSLGSSNLSPAPSPAGSQNSYGSHSQPPSHPRQTTQQTQQNQPRPGSQQPQPRLPAQQSQPRPGNQQPQPRLPAQQSQTRPQTQAQRPHATPSHSNPHLSARERTIPPDPVSVPPRGSSSSDETRSPTIPPTQQQHQYPPTRRQTDSSGKAPENASNKPPSTPTAAQGPGSDSSLDTSPPAISSALSVLMAPPTTTAASKPSYRYAPKSVIANTYMSQLGSKSLEQYQQNRHAEQQRVPGSPTAKVQPMSPPQSERLTTEASSPAKPGASPHSPHYHHHHRRPHSPPANTQYDPYSNEPPPYPVVPPYKIDPHYRPNAPRPLRRRWSITEMDEHPKHGQVRPQPPQSDAETSKPESSPPDVIRVDQTIQEDKPTTLLKDDVPFIDDSSTRNTPPPAKAVPVPVTRRKTNIKNKNSQKSSKRVSFDPLALLLDASLEGELELVKTTARQVSDPSASNDEGITALHNAICAGHYEIVRFLVEYGCDVNSPDSDGWTPLHCAASCNNLGMVKFLVEHGACIFATTISDHETAAEKCEEDEDGFDGCSEYLYSVQEKLGILKQGSVYAVFDYEAENRDELTFRNRDQLTVLRKGDEHEVEWWWARKAGSEGYIPRNLLGLYPRVIPEWLRKDSTSEKK